MDRLMSFVIVGVIAAVMIQCAAAQTEYVVGDSLGWAVPPNGAQAYTTWASSKTFVVGDILTFNFNTNEHDVQQVTKDSYDACNSTNPIGNAITTGPANITLTSAGDHYYICTVGRHCQAGQKLHVTVSGTPGATPPSTNTPPTTPSTPSPTSSTPDACAPTPSPTPSTDGPTSSTVPGAVPPPPDSSSSAVFASFFLALVASATGFIL
ncbi:hypothetical protein F0562_024587 [Nyssa sinensis]|uniref:Phytocyanin domain-containing protein n=1 Tax=Nyssa sinensis TaxID=561372 RepID=A0A5J5BCV3_9ASTE|nr:hypothetical protein F0562_024587 [Nyssa sinensis]